MLRSLPTRSDSCSCVYPNSLDQALIAGGLFQRVEILALQVLDQRHLERLGRRDVAHDRRHLMKTRPLRRAPAALAGDQLEPAVGTGAHDERLDDPLHADGRRQLLEPRVVEVVARLARGRGECPRWRWFASRRPCGPAAGARLWPDPGAEAGGGALGIRAASPRPRALRLGTLIGHRRRWRAPLLPVARQQLAREIQVALGALARRCRRGGSACRTKAPRTGARCAGSSCVKTLSPKWLRTSLGDLLGEVLPRVDHAEHDALDLEPGVQRLADQSIVRCSARQPFERVVLALQRHQHRVGRAERVQRQQAQRGRAVDEDVVVAVGRRADRSAQLPLAVRHRHELDLGAGQVGVGGHQVQVRQLGVADDLLQGPPARPEGRRRWALAASPRT